MITTNKRNERKRQNRTSREKATPNRTGGGNVAPITDIRQKKSSTINVDELPQSKFVDANSSVTLSNNARGKKETLNNSLEKDA